MRPARVLHLIKSLGRGGAEMLLAEGLRFADREAFHYRYAYFLPWKDAMVPALRAQRADVTCFGGRNNLRILGSARRVAAFIRSERIDLVHCHLPVAGAVGRVAGRLADVPVVYTEHNEQERYHPATRILNRWTWGWQARVVAVSADVERSIQAHIGSRVPVEVVLNGVDVDRFNRAGVSSAQVREAYGIPTSSPVVGSVAVFRIQKQLADWVEAARIIREHHPAVHFLLVGDGPLRQEVEGWIAAAGLQSVIHLTGLQEEVRPFLACMDVYMMSSIFEGLPVALLEAMSMECVPVCTRVGGIPELIHPGENGLLVPPRSPDSLGRAVSGLLDEPRLGRELATSARRTVELRFSMRRMAQELEGMYSNILDRNGRFHRSAH